MKWYDPGKKPPDPFVSVLVHVPSELPLPTVHEGYMAENHVWYTNGCFYNETEIHRWADMPVYTPEEDYEE